MNITSIYNIEEDEQMQNFCHECGARTHDRDLRDGSKWFPDTKGIRICIDCEQDYLQHDNEEKKTA